MDEPGGDSNNKGATKKLRSKKIGLFFIILGVCLPNSGIDYPFLNIIRCFGFLYTIHNFIS